MANVFSLSETIRLASPHLYSTKCFSQHKSSIVASAVHICISTAVRDVPLDRLYLSPLCGFASCEIGNNLTEQKQ